MAGLDFKESSYVPAEDDTSAKKCFAGWAVMLLSRLDADNAREDLDDFLEREVEIVVPMIAATYRGNAKKYQWKGVVGLIKKVKSPEEVSTLHDILYNYSDEDVVGKSWLDLWGSLCEDPMVASGNGNANAPRGAVRMYAGNQVEARKSGPKMMFEQWTGGDLTKWMKWVRAFTSLQREYATSEESAIVRLLVNTQDSEEAVFVKALDDGSRSWEEIIQEITKIKEETRAGAGKGELTDVVQGRGSVEKYFTEFEENREDIERYKEITFSEREKIEKFKLGLWGKIKSQLVIKEIPEDNLFQFFREVQKIEKKVRQLFPSSQGKGEQTGTNKTGKDSGGKGRTHLTEEEQKKPEQPKKDCRNGKDCTVSGCQFKHPEKTPRRDRICYQYRDTGACHRENCKFKHEKGTEKGQEKRGGSLNFVNETHIHFSKAKDEEYKGSSREVLSLWDPGSNTMICAAKDYFDTFEAFQKPRATRVGGGNLVKLLGIGTVKFKSRSNQTGNDISIRMLYGPDFKYNLISHSKLDKKGSTFSGSNGKMEFKMNGKRYMTAEMKDNGLYILDIEPVKRSDGPIYAGYAQYVEEDIYEVYTAEAEVAKKQMELLDDWHRRLAHMSVKKILTMAKNDLAIGLEEIKPIPYSRAVEYLCEDCAKFRHLVMYKPHKKLASTKSMSKDIVSKVESKNLEVIGSWKSMKPKLAFRIASDLSGPFPETSRGNKYISIRVLKEIGDVRATAIQKKDMKTVVKDMKKFCEEMNGKGIDLISHESDKGKEYVNRETEEYLRERGIQQTIGTGHDSVANAVAERGIRTHQERIAVQLGSMSMPTTDWDYALENSDDIGHKMLNSKGIVPYSIINNGAKPDFSHLHVFGCKCRAWKPTQDKNKLGQKNVIGCYLGSAPPNGGASTKGHFIRDMETDEVFQSMIQKILFTKKNINK